MFLSLLYSFLMCVHAETILIGSVKNILSIINYDNGYNISGAFPCTTPNFSEVETPPTLARYFSLPVERVEQGGKKEKKTTCELLGRSRKLQVSLQN